MLITLPARLARPSAVGFGGIGVKAWGLEALPAGRALAATEITCSSHLSTDFS